jgi:YebC/PmpR family DNA-binding regulatory protein
MAGHSKWANIKRHKAKQDSKKAGLYTKIIREVTVAAKLGGADADSNPRLRAALDKANDANMTKDVIERAVKRGAGGMEGESVEEIRYEGYGPSGIAVMVDTMTNNRNRTVGEVRHAFSKHGGNLGTDGSVGYLFTKKGSLTYAPGVDEDKLMEIALELGVDDVITNDDGSVEVVTGPDIFLQVKDALIKQKFTPADSEITMVASTSVTITEKEAAESVTNLIDALEELDDVQEVYSNADIAEEALA